MEKITDFFKKIIEFIKKNYIMVTIIASIIVIIIIGIIIVNIINARNRAKYSYDTGNYYEYFDTEKHEFSANLTYENKVLKTFVGNNYSIYGSNIIYNKDDNNMVLPKDYEIVLYFLGNEYKLNKYSEINYIVNMNTINSNGKSVITSKFFLYDGADTYFIPDDFILHVGGKDIDVSAYSYLYVTDDVVSVYDYSKDTVTKYNQDSKYAYVKCDKLYISFDKKVYKYNDKTYLLTNDINNLTVYE